MSSVLRVLDFDSECRPISYLGSDYTTADVTAIAWSWIDGTENMVVYAQGRVNRERMLEAFVDAYDEADLVTGHYITGHDLPVLNGALLEAGMASLGDKMVSDTKMHLLKRKYVSASQESLAQMLGIEAPKIHMTQSDWRSANRLEDAGIQLAVDRCTGDVRQHVEMYHRLVDRGWLGPAKRWSAASKGGSGGYHP